MRATGQVSQFTGTLLEADRRIVARERFSASGLVAQAVAGKTPVAYGLASS